MGERTSIRFVNGDEKSLVLFHHWGGPLFEEEVRGYARDLKREIEANKDNPRVYGALKDLEPRTVMVDFIRYYTRKAYGSQRVWDSLYVGIDENDGDNSDWGHHDIELSTTVLQDVLEEARR